MPSALRQSVFFLDVSLVERDAVFLQPPFGLLAGRAFGITNKLHEVYLLFCKTQSHPLDAMCGGLFAD